MIKFVIKVLGGLVLMPVKLAIKVYKGISEGCKEVSNDFKKYVIKD